MRKFDSIPEGMRALRRWTLHRAEAAKDGGKSQKVPYQRNGQHASSTNAATWADFSSVVPVPKGFDGISFALCAEDGLVCVDIDGCRDPENGQIEPWAQAIVDKLNSYTEISPSGTGLHIFVKGTIPKNSHRHGSRVEMYSDKKIMATTGNCEFLLGSESIESRDLSALFARAEAGEFAPQRAAKPKVAANDSDEDWRLIGEVQREAQCQDTAALEAAFQKAHPERYAARNREKGGRAGQNYFRYTIENFLRRNPPPEAAKPKGKPEKVWRDIFHTGSELDTTPTRIFIDGILEEGITAIGALSGVGKTWLGLAISRALITGESLFGTFKVHTRTNVLYLVPEMGGRRFRERLVKMKIPMDGSFFCQTITDGACNLRDPLLLEAVAAMRPTVILDTAIRFNQTEDENQALNNAQGLAAQLFNLMKHGADTVICMHHRSKASRDAEVMTLENVLRGSGDFGAMCDVVWGVEHDRGPKRKGGWNEDYIEESQGLTRLFLKCVKPRDMVPADPFRIQGRPYIDQKGDFVVLASPSVEENAPTPKADDEKVLELISAQPTLGVRAIMRATGYGHNRVDRIIKAAKLVQIDGTWRRTEENNGLHF